MGVGPFKSKERELHEQVMTKLLPKQLWYNKYCSEFNKTLSCIAN